MIGRLTDTLMWLEMGKCISIYVYPFILSIYRIYLFIYLFIRSNYLLDLFIYHLSLSVYLHLSLPVYLPSLTICLSIISLSSSGMGDAYIFQASIFKTGGKLEFLPLSHDPSASPGVSKPSPIMHLIIVKLSREQTSLGPVKGSAPGLLYLLFFF